MKQGEQLMTKKGLSGTFLPNRVEPIHRWYSYIEGYSSELVEKELSKLDLDSISSIYDPFGGTGTTLLAASCKNIKPYYSETNPFMRGVVETKINDVRSLTNYDDLVMQIDLFKEKLFKSNLREETIDVAWDGFEKYFTEEALKDVLLIKNVIQEEQHNHLKRILMLALSSVLVKSSKMIRRGDLRFAKEREKKDVCPVREAFLMKLDEIIDDIIQHGASVKKNVELLAPDVRDIDAENLIDCIITSPPYLNGTNYIRNTKLELKLNDYIVGENDLKQYHSEGIVAGINNVSKRKGPGKRLKCIEGYLEQLTPVAYDKRIPIMVERYFYDMNEVLIKLSQVLKNDGVFIMDIGDSQFAGVHIPTHDILSELCENNGFRKYDEEILRDRYSKNGMKLSQKVLRFILEK